MPPSTSTSGHRPLEGKVALITGAGRTGGMGQGAARCLAEAGANVVITDLAVNRPELRQTELHKLGDDLGLMEEFVANLAAEVGGNHLALALDVTNQAQAEDVMNTVVTQLGSLDILFNNAGATTGVGRFLEQTDQQWDMAWQVNTMGTRRLSMLAIPIMAAQGGGVIVNNISVGGLVADAGFGAYNATKFGVAAITKMIAKEHGSDGIRCVGVCPGYIETGMADAQLELMADLEGVTPSAAEEMMVGSIPLGRAGQATDVGQLVAFLCSPQASFISGALIPIDGGWLP